MTAKGPLIDAMIALSTAMAEARIRRMARVDVAALVRLLAEKHGLSAHDAARLREAAARFAEPEGG